MWNADHLKLRTDEQNSRSRCSVLLCVWSEVLQRTNAVFPWQIAQEVGLENLEALTINCISTISGDVKAWGMRLMNYEGIRHHDKAEPIFTDNTLLTFIYRLPTKPRMCTTSHNSTNVNPNEKQNIVVYKRVPLFHFYSNSGKCAPTLIGHSLLQS